MKNRMLVVALLLALGCGNRPPEITEATAFKREVLAQALSDKQVRDQAYRQTVYEREFTKCQADLSTTLAMAENVETDSSGKAYIRGKDAAGNVVREPIQVFIQRAIALADSNKQKICNAVAAETAADDVVNAKLMAALQLDIAIEQYQQAVEKGTSPQDINAIVKELIKAVKPLLKE